MKKWVVMLPCYNEEENIIPLVEKWMSLSDDFFKKDYRLSIHCIDDKSTDETKQTIAGLVARFPDYVSLIAHRENKGLGGALQTAFDAFLDMGSNGDVCVLMDGDNTHDPKFALTMIKPIEADADIVIASRYCDTSSTKGVSALRQFLSWGARQYYSLVLRVPHVKDYTCGYRAYRYSILQNAQQTLGKQWIEKRSFACMMEALYKLHVIGGRFAEVPFALRYDIKQGESKMRLFKTIKESLLTAPALKRAYKKRDRSSKSE